jgi:hypothetical protein
MQLASCVPFLFCRHSAKRQFLLNAESRYDGIWRRQAPEQDFHQDAVAGVELREF